MIYEIRVKRFAGLGKSLTESESKNLFFYNRANAEIAMEILYSKTTLSNIYFIREIELIDESEMRKERELISKLKKKIEEL